MTEDRKSHAMLLVEVRTGRELEELLHELYVDRRWADREIAAQLGVARSTVVLWRATFGIERSERTTVLDA